MPGEDNLEDGAANEDLVVNTLENEVDVESELSKLRRSFRAGDFTDCKTARLQCRISQFRPHRSQSQQVKQKSNSR